MGKITVFGAGYFSLPTPQAIILLISRTNRICGLSSATILSSPKPDDPNWTPHEITIVARDLPGDEPSQDWASPWYVQPAIRLLSHLEQQPSIHLHHGPWVSSLRSTPQSHIPAVKSPQHTVTTTHDPSTCTYRPKNV